MKMIGGPVETLLKTFLGLHRLTAGAKPNEYDPARYSLDYRRRRLQSIMAATIRIIPSHETSKWNSSPANEMKTAHCFKMFQA
jgi:hypothetical protein